MRFPLRQETKKVLVKTKTKKNKKQHEALCPLRQETLRPPMVQHINDLYYDAWNLIRL